MKKATFIKEIKEGFVGEARLYKVDPPMFCEETESKYEYVIVSGVYALGSGPETYIFGADENGIVLHWGELNGSFRGEIDHAQALSNAGYEEVWDEKD
jgi:hypothetical protein